MPSGYWPTHGLWTHAPWTRCPPGARPPTSGSRPGDGTARGRLGAGDRGRGFHGHWIVRALRQAGTPVRMMVRRPTPAADGVEVVLADLGDPASLAGACRGIRTVIHCAPQVSGPAELCRQVNAVGTEALLADADRHAVPNLVYLSTAAVYGQGPFRDAAPAELTAAPRSAASRTRLTAEQLTLERGGTVLRPHLVYGEGDRWVLPGLLALDGALGAADRDRIAGTLHSVIDVRDLADAVRAAAALPVSLGGIHHLVHPEPVGYADLAAAVRTVLAPTPAEPPPAEPPPAEPPPAGPPPAGPSPGPEQLEHLLSMAGVDHWFANSPAWAALDSVPRRGLRQSLPDHGAWYRAQSAQLTPS
ncbi:NAD-dependent epimerase/dehydratase family protein [Streptacidiphilus sp. PAMC 29251]